MASLNDCGTSRGSLALGISHHIRPIAIQFGIRYKTKWSNAMRMLNLIRDANILRLLGALLHKCDCLLFEGCKKIGSFVNWACLSPPKRTLLTKGEKEEARREKATPLPSCVSLFAFHLLPLASPLLPKGVGRARRHRPYKRYSPLVSSDRHGGLSLHTDRL